MEKYICIQFTSVKIIAEKQLSIKTESYISSSVITHFNPFLPKISNISQYGNESVIILELFFKFFYYLQLLVLFYNILWPLLNENFGGKALDRQSYFKAFLSNISNSSQYSNKSVISRTLFFFVSVAKSIFCFN